MLERTGPLGFWQIWFESLLCCLPSVWSWACYLTSLSLSFLILNKSGYLYSVLTWCVSGRKQKIENISGVIMPPRKINRVRTERVTRYSFRCGVRGHRRQMRVYRHPRSCPAGRGHLVSAGLLPSAGRRSRWSEWVNHLQSKWFDQRGPRCGIYMQSLTLISCRHILGYIVKHFFH